MTSERPSPRFLPAADVLSGETADVYFERARTILAAERLDPVVTMEIFSRGEGILCGAEEALAYLREIFAEANGAAAPVVQSLHDGDTFSSKEVVMRIEARYSALHKLDHVDGDWLADQLARLQARYREVQLVFADSRRYAEDWTYRYLTTALADAAAAAS